MAIGRPAMTTAAWADVVDCRAMVVSTGNPTTTPSPIPRSGRRAARPGHGTRAAASATRATTPAIAARPMAITTGSKPRSAIFVNGRVKENITTAARASSSPRRTDEPGAVTVGSVDTPSA